MAYLCFPKLFTCQKSTCTASSIPLPLGMPKFHSPNFGALSFNTSSLRSSVSCCVGWDPEGILGPPSGGHIARREFQKRFKEDDEQRDALQHQLRQERDRRRATREARVVPDTAADLVEYFLETEAPEIEYEIARCRPRLNQDFLEYLQAEMATLRFALSRTKEMDDRLVELEALHKVLTEGIEAYDRMAVDIIGAKDRLAKILASKDKKATLLEMVERNELDRSLLALLDENIAAAQAASQEQAVLFMEKIRAAILKYLTI